ncbi:MAG: phosphotransferase [Caldilineaceae bacterium]
MNPTYLPRIQALCPDLAIETVVLNTDGLANEVVIINETLVFRFTTGEYSRRALAGEVSVLTLIRPHITLPMPDPFHVSDDLMAYSLLPGAALTRQVWEALDEQDQQVVADQLATFLRQLHATPGDATIPTTVAPCRYADQAGIYARVKEKVYPLLLKHQIAWAEALYASVLDDPTIFDYTPQLIHGDLACYHILFDPTTRRLAGIIDFGVAGLGDPALDLGCLYQYYGAGFVNRLYDAYPTARTFAKRTQFYAQAGELAWVLQGLESGEPFWFTAHIGAA